MRIYISGKISGDALYKAKFRRAADAIKAAGHTPLNPAEGNAGMTNTEAMQRALNMVCEADAVLMLPDWQKSEGAKIERRLAQYLGIRVEYLENALCEKGRKLYCG